MRLHFQVQHLYLLVLSNFEFADGWCNERKFTNWEGNQNVLAFFMLSSYFDKITISDINQDVFSGCEFLVKSVLLTFDPYFLYLLSVWGQTPYYNSPHNAAQ